MIKMDYTPIPSDIKPNNLQTWTQETNSKMIEKEQHVTKRINKYTENILQEHFQYLKETLHIKEKSFVNKIFSKQKEEYDSKKYSILIKKTIEKKQLPDNINDQQYLVLYGMDYIKTHSKFSSTILPPEDYIHFKKVKEIYKLFDLYEIPKLVQLTIYLKHKNEYITLEDKIHKRTENFILLFLLSFLFNKNSKQNGESDNTKSKEKPKYLAINILYNLIIMKDEYYFNNRFISLFINNFAKYHFVLNQYAAIRDNNIEQKENFILLNNFITKISKYLYTQKKVIEKMGKTIIKMEDEIIESDNESTDDEERQIDKQLEDLCETFSDDEIIMFIYIFFRRDKQKLEQNFSQTTAEKAWNIITEAVETGGGDIKGNSSTMYYILK